MTKRPGDAACGDTAPRMLLERYWERMLRRIKGSAESIEHTSDSERPRDDLARNHPAELNCPLVQGCFDRGQR
jgi:hypothetical protein